MQNASPRQTILDRQRTERSNTERIARRRADTPKRYRKLYDRCMAAKASPRDAIRMQCLECWAWVQTETAQCDNCACPLFRYRPYQKPAQVPDWGSSATQNQQTQAEG
jgi:hypothetical protein